MLHEFVNCTKPTENITSITSVDHTIAAREIGITKTLADIGSSFNKGGSF